MHDPAAYDTPYPSGRTPPARPRKDPSPYFPDADDYRRQLDWERHVDAGRIGTRTPIAEHILTRIEHNERVLRRFSCR